MNRSFLTNKHFLASQQNSQDDTSIPPFYIGSCLSLSRTSRTKTRPASTPPEPLPYISRTSKSMLASLPLQARPRRAAAPLALIINPPKRHHQSITRSCIFPHFKHTRFCRFSKYGDGFPFNSFGARIPRYIVPLSIYCSHLPHL